MDYHCLDLMVYNNSRHALAELLSGIGIERQKLDSWALHCEQMIDDAIFEIPFSEERLSLFALVYIGIDIREPMLLSAFARDDKTLVCQVIELMIRSNSVIEQPDYSIKVITELLGCNKVG